MGKKATSIPFNAFIQGYSLYPRNVNLLISKSEDIAVPDAFG